MEKPAEKLAQFYRTRRRMPSYAEAMKLLGYQSKGAARYAIEKLLEAGVIAKDRTGRLLPGNLAGGARLLGLVEAGFPSAAEEELLDVMDFDEYLTPNKESSYILRVKGDSMIDAGIQDGDMVIVERRQTYKPGQIVVASVDGEYTLKYLRKARDTYYLEPANAKYKPIYAKDRLMVEAVVTAVVRKY
ncbi:MAG TPA: transcriptional repressor LexA [Candidatus Paceibacterota bacterium]|nr:transcriptional repressor LexA [Candidatus Paceibacterota bacterium]